MSMQLTHSAALSGPERLALTALMDSTVISKARREHRAEQATRRKAIRARLSATQDVEQQIAQAAASVASASAACTDALSVLGAARHRYNEAYVELYGLEMSRDNLKNAVAVELGALADERCLPVDQWLQSLRHLVRSSIRTHAEPRSRRVTIRGMFGMDEQSVTDMVEVSNVDLVEKTVVAIDALRDRVRALVLEFDGPDVGPELKRIQGEALATIQPLGVEGAIRLNDVPALTVED